MILLFQKWPKKFLLAVNGAVITQQCSGPVEGLLGPHSRGFEGFSILWKNIGKKPVGD